RGAGGGEWGGGGGAGRGAGGAGERGGPGEAGSRAGGQRSRPGTGAAARCTAVTRRAGAQQALGSGALIRTSRRVLRASTALMVERSCQLRCPVSTLGLWTRSPSAS